jgi:hypothetical protein
MSRNRIHHSPPDAAEDDRRYILNAFRRSGLSRRAFCAETGVPVSTLTRWLVREPTTTPITFAEIQAPASPTVTWALEVALPGGVILRWRDRPDVADLVAVLHDARC